MEPLGTLKGLRLANLFFVIALVVFDYFGVEFANFMLVMATAIAGGTLLYEFVAPNKENDRYHWIALTVWMVTIIYQILILTMMIGTIPEFRIFSLGEDLRQRYAFLSFIGLMYGINVVLRLRFFQRVSIITPAFAAISCVCAFTYGYLSWYGLHSWYAAAFYIVTSFLTLIALSLVSRS